MTQEVQMIYERTTAEVVELSRKVTAALQAAAVARGLATIASLQESGASNLPPQLREYDTNDFRSAALGAFVELGELVNECQWKPWRNYEDPTDAERQKVLEEFADVLHFIGWMTNNLQSRFGLSTEDFAAAFMAVHERNIARFTGRIPGHEPPG